MPRSADKTAPPPAPPPSPDPVPDFVGIDEAANTMLDAGGAPDDQATAQEVASQEEVEDALSQRIRQRLAHNEAASSRDPLIGQEIGGRFTIVSKVGEGGMGAVYRARQRNMDRDVAIKVLLGNVATNETVVKRFHLEALAVSKLSHPNTIQIFDFGETEDKRLYIAMEFLEGVSLHATLDYEGVLAVRRALRITGQVAKSLREAHAKGIVHRDLKPDNIFLQSVGEETDFVKVLDFGVAKIRDENKHNTDLTKTGTIFGTPKYMSPEQARGGQIDPRADVYAMGVILYEMLTGRVPFDAESSLGILIKHIQEPHPPLDHVRPDLVYPEGVHKLIDRLLAKRAEDRPQSAEALIREIAKIDADLDDLYRNVVTQEDAIRVGLEMATSPKTRHDTRLTGTAAEALVTQGPFRDPTLQKREQHGLERRWPMVLLLAAAAVLVLATGAVAAAYSSLEPLPRHFIGLPPLVGVDDTVGTVPPIQQEVVHVVLACDPADAEIYVDGEKTGGSPPLVLRHRKGSAPKRVTFKREGYKPASTTVEFHKDRSETISLTALVTPRAPRPPPSEPTAAPRPRPTSAAKPAVTSKPTATAQPTTKPATKPDDGESMKLKVDRLKGVDSGMKLK